MKTDEMLTKNWAAIGVYIVVDDDLTHHPNVLKCGNEKLVRHLVKIHNESLEKEKTDAIHNSRTRKT